MSSSSVKDLSKAIAAAISSSTFPLPSSLLDSLQHYLTKNAEYEDEQSQRLQDELLSIYTTQVLDTPSRLAPFLSTLRILKPAFAGAGRLVQWWDTLHESVLKNAGFSKVLQNEVSLSILDLLVRDEDDMEEVEELRKDKQAVAEHAAESLVNLWILQDRNALNRIDRQSSFVSKQVQYILLAFGRQRPKDLLLCINKFVIGKETRIMALTLLGEFIRHQPPHLHQMIQTPLFGNLLKCLQIDTSTRVISLAMTALVMFLPHIPSSLGPHLPALFNIYSRMLFWERERRTGSSDPEVDNFDESGWVKMSYLLESDDETVPELLHYFTFLYGLYPINFMSYIRKPQKYLRNAEFPGADELDIEPSEIRERSESYRRVHLLHPNFFHLTLESELTDTHRWQNSEVADVVTECMSLYTASDNQEQGVRARGPIKKLNLGSDISDHVQIESASSPSRHISASSSSQQRNSRVLSANGDSPTLPALGSDSPTIPPQMLTAAPNIQLSDMLNDQRYLKGSASKSIASLQPSSYTGPPLDLFSALKRDSIPDTVTTNVEPDVKIAYLHREIQLLRNDLNFERFLKAQHLSHIGQLKQRQLKEARVEAETQNLINSNRQLRSKLEEAKRLKLQTMKETEKSKTHARKWETDLSNRLRALKEDQRTWTTQVDELKRDLASARLTVDQLRLLVVTSESKELHATMKVKHIEASLEDLRRLRAENERLGAALKRYEAKEDLAVKAVENEGLAQREVKILQMMLDARENDLLRAKLEFDRDLHNLLKRYDGREDDLRKRDSLVSKDTFDSALASSRNRIMELQKAYNHLQKRYTDLQKEHLDLKCDMEQQDFQQPLLSTSPSRQPSHGDDHGPTPMRSLSQRSNIISETESWESSDLIASSSGAPRPLKVDTMQTSAGSSSEKSPASTRSPLGGGASHFMGTEPFLSMIRPSSKGMETDFDHDATPKIKPQSDMRIYGRGGVQNIGKKDKKDKGKEKELVKDDGKKDKKSSGLRGIRAFGS